MEIEIDEVETSSGAGVILSIGTYTIGPIPISALKELTDELIEFFGLEVI